MALTQLQENFVNEYLIDFNATRAAERAGYKGDENTLAVTGYRLLRIDKIAEAISARLQEKSMGPDEVLRRLGEQARAEYSAYIMAQGWVNLPQMIADGNAHLIKGIKETAHGKVIEFHDAQAALVQIGKHHKLFTEKVEHDLTDRAADSAAALIAAMRQGANSDGSGD